MRKIMPMILVTLFLASFFAGVQWTELEDTQTDSAGARAGPDPAVMDLTNPRETSVDSITGEQRNTLNAGQKVNFDAYIKNLGDSDILDMAVKVEIRYAEAGVAGNVVVDNAGVELSWQNSDVVCNDANTCPYSSLAAGDLLANGKYRVQYGGADLEWIPEVGEYFVQVHVSTNGPNDEIENDMVENFVAVTNWYDIVVELDWGTPTDNDEDRPRVETGDGMKAFTLTVRTDGSVDWDARDVKIQLKASGTLTSATGADGEDLMAADGATITAGESSMIEVFHNMTSFAEKAENITPAPTQVDDDSQLNPCAPKVTPCNMSRSVVAAGVEWTWSGNVLPDTSGGSGNYEIEAMMISYSSYDAHQECIETAESLEGEAESWENSCEKVMEQDDDSGTNEDSIWGAISNFHDIATTEITFGQGFAFEGDEARYIRSMGETLDVGTTLIQATVEHKGSSETTLYDWEVSFTVTDPDGVDYQETANECLSGMQPTYNHKELGVSMSTDQMGFACISYNFGPGEYSVSAEVSMVNPNVAGDTFVDENTGNDEMSFNIEAANNPPNIQSLILETEGTLVIGSDLMITLEADAFDADDPDGMDITYNWTTGTGDELPCTGMGELFSSCELIVDPTWVPSRTIRLIATDEYGESSMPASIDVPVWNYVEATNTTASGITVDYHVTYSVGDDFSFSLSDSETNFQQVVLNDTSDDGGFTKYAGKYDSIKVVDYDPSIPLTGANTVLASKMVVTFESNLGATSLWFTINNLNENDWQLVSDTVTPGNSSEYNTFVVEDFSSVVSAGVLQRGKLVMFAGALTPPEKPNMAPDDLTMDPAKDGGLLLNWGYTGTPISGDNYYLTICETADSSVCLDGYGDGGTRGERVGQNADMPYVVRASAGLTTHGTEYTATVKVCNTDTSQCNDLMVTDTATAKSRINGDFDVTDLTVSGADGKWTVAWKAEGVGSDVTKWKVCYQTAEFSANEMNQGTCSMHSDGLTATVDMPEHTSPGTYPYFITAAPMDDLGHIVLQEDLTKTQIVIGEDVIPDAECPDSEKDASGNCITGESTKSGSDDVPGWTWGVIIGIVVVAFLVGAFILSRGGEEAGEEGDKDWDY